MATFQKVLLPANVPTLIVTGNGQRVLLQGNTFYLGGADVTIGNGIFISVGGAYNDFIDLDRVMMNKSIYAISEFDNELGIFVYNLA